MKWLERTFLYTMYECNEGYSGEWNGKGADK
jgi:hypothetical protein